ncbi:MAG: prepilin-type N-terminal cleavage/methylation domain-containing protein [candidate division Zixibacteria bacterium]|nr:prepilin-type N-terminal cleavage/methylation domain-containing protein [candidate division Zixibacteria bacterium]NIR63205.1 prepilin-type N-terminal cleavage/methylation domain-containing protein [candidate division Zixibacteria bacterium]NIS16903.1 prepilin-type N-terminal cleavage/methylation domain-containing protein [candidate division Zixibacteria bacterium]NIS45182.1 prepilin-type N-terminal cleavage/methylation domain-containing protein [candidate division Zixibacteria bacterium]NIT
MKKKFGKKHGFTILELMSAVVIIGIIAAIGIPTMDLAIKKIRFKADSNTIMSGLRLARSEAISHRIQYGVSFDTGSNQLAVFKDVSSPDLFTFDLADSVVFLDTLGRGVENMTTTFDNNLVFFFPDGRASMSGNINGTASWSTDSLTSASVNISVLAATGRIKVDSLTY